MAHHTALGAVPGYRGRRALRRAELRVHQVTMLFVYGLFGLAGVLLWLLMRLPMSPRWKETTVYAMAGCVGLFTVGWQMLQAQRAPLTTGRHSH